MKTRNDVTITLDHNSLLVLARYGLTVALHSMDGFVDYNMPGHETGTVVFADGNKKLLYVWRAYVIPFDELTALITASVEDETQVSDTQFVIVVKFNDGGHTIERVFETQNGDGPVFDINFMSVTFESE